MRANWQEEFENPSGRLRPTIQIIQGGNRPYNHTAPIGKKTPKGPLVSGTHNIVTAAQLVLREPSEHRACPQRGGLDATGLAQPKKFE